MFGIIAGIDQHRSVSGLLHRPVNEIRCADFALRDVQRIDLQRRNARSLSGAHLSTRRLRTASGDNEGAAFGSRHASTRCDLLQQALPSKILGQAHGNAGTARNQSMIGSCRTHGNQMTIADRIDDGEPRTATRRLSERVSRRVNARFHNSIGHQTDVQPGLTLHDAHEIGIAHRRQRMILHRAFSQRNLTHEQIAEIDCTLVGRKRGAD